MKRLTRAIEVKPEALPGLQVFTRGAPGVGEDVGDVIGLVDIHVLQVDVHQGPRARRILEVVHRLDLVIDEAGNAPDRGLTLAGLHARHGCGLAGAGAHGPIHQAGRTVILTERPRLDGVVDDDPGVARGSLAEVGDLDAGQLFDRLGFVLRGQQGDGVVGAGLQLVFGQDDPADLRLGEFLTGSARLVTGLDELLVDSARHTHADLHLLARAGGGEQTVDDPVVLGTGRGKRANNPVGDLVPARADLGEPRE